jgi:aminopeptidase N
VFEDSTGRDLSQFKRWYTQAGTPRLTVKDAWYSGTYILTFTQNLKASPTTPDPQPQVIPIVTGLLDRSGQEIVASRVLEMTKPEQSFRFEGLAARPVPSVLRDFSAPVILERELDASHTAFLLAHDTDPFNRWEAGRTLARDSLLASIRENTTPSADYLDALRKVLSDHTLDPAYRALMLGLPSQSELATLLHDAGETPDPQGLWQASEAMRDAQAAHFADLLPGLYEAHQVAGAYKPDADQSGRRGLANAVLALWARRGGVAQAQAQFDAADNMTQQLAALAVLLQQKSGAAALDAFEKDWKHDRLVMDKWFGLQVMQAAPEDVAQTARTLTEHADFNWKNPNRFRSVLGALSTHHAGFHHANGLAYDLLADWLIRLDPVNPQTTARMCLAYQTWRRYDAARQDRIARALDRILATPDLSRDTTEMLSRIRGDQS